VQVRCFDNVNKNKVGGNGQLPVRVATFSKGLGIKKSRTRTPVQQKKSQPKLLQKGLSIKVQADPPARGGGTRMPGKKLRQEREGGTARAECVYSAQAPVELDEGEAARRRRT